MRCLERMAWQVRSWQLFLPLLLSEGSWEGGSSYETHRVYLATSCPVCSSYSFTTSGQMLAINLNEVYSKQMRYARQMRYMNSLTRTQSRWESNRSEIFQVVTESLANPHPLPPVSDVARYLVVPLSRFQG